MDFITANWFIPIGGLLVMILVGWRMDKDTVLAECIHGSNAQWFVKPWFFVLKWIAPVIMLIIILQKAGLLPFLV